MMGVSPAVRVSEIRNQFPGGPLLTPATSDSNPLEVATINGREIASELFASGSLGYVGYKAEDILPLISLKEHRA
jgi:hypothetical protein